MKYLILCIGLTSIIPVNAIGGDNLLQKSPIVLVCEMKGLSFKAAAELRNKKLTKQAAVIELQRLLQYYESSDAIVVVDSVYDDYKDKDPSWIEGYQFATCMSAMPKEPFIKSTTKQYKQT
jgi:hypothetical protein